MSQIRMIIKNRRSGEECLCGGEELVVVFPYGLSPLASSIEEELQKVRLAEKLGVDMVKDNSVGRREWFKLLKYVAQEINLPIGASATLAAANLAVDAGNRPTEVQIAQEFAKRAIAKGTSIIVGVFGHIDPSKTAFFERVRQEIPVPIGGLGPLATDIALGYDHINAAISVVLFRPYLDWVSIITPAEHIGMPNLNDDADGITAFNIARHILDLQSGKGKERDLRMAEARTRKLWCAGMPEFSLNPYSLAVARVAREKWPDGCPLFSASSLNKRAANAFAALFVFKKSIFWK